MARVDVNSDEYKLGQNILKYRKAKKWSQQDLGNAVDMDRANVGKYENGTKGEMGFRLLMKFAAALDVSVDQLLDFDNGENKKVPQSRTDALEEYKLLNVASRRMVDPVIHMALAQQKG